MPLQMVDVELATVDAGPVFSGRFSIPADAISPFNFATATVSFAQGVPLIRVVLDSQNKVVDYLTQLLLEDGSVLCCEDGSLLTWPWPAST